MWRLKLNYHVGSRADIKLSLNLIQISKVLTSEIEFKEFEPGFKSAKNRFESRAGLNLETFDTILSGTNHI